MPSPGQASPGQSRELKESGETDRGDEPIQLLVASGRSRRATADCSGNVHRRTEQLLFGTDFPSARARPERTDGSQSNDSGFFRRNAANALRKPGSSRSGTALENHFRRRRGKTDSAAKPTSNIEVGSGMAVMVMNCGPPPPLPFAPGVPVP